MKAPPVGFLLVETNVQLQSKHKGQIFQLECRCCRKVAWCPYQSLYLCLAELIPFSPGSRKPIKVNGHFRHRVPRQNRRRISLKRNYVDTEAQLGLLHNFFVTTFLY